MLRYFYIFICIHVSFSYDYSERNLLEGSKIRNNRKHDAESDVVQLDMDSFMSSDDDPQDYEPFDFNSKLNRGTQNEDYYESPIYKFKREENVDYSALKELNNDGTLSTPKDDVTLIEQTSEETEKENKISAAEEKEFDDTPVERPNAIKDQQKKCLFRNMKIPFFSHKTMKQRRKLVCINCGDSYTIDPESQTNEKVNQLVRRLKRAYGNVCPKCMRKVLQRFHKKKLTNPAKTDQLPETNELNQIMPTTVSKEKELEKTSTEDTFEYLSTEKRAKRDEVHERQLKELAEVEMKVEKVEITTPKVDSRLFALTTL